jgi:hypothetical protein
MKTLLKLSLGRKRDLLVARLRLRQLCQLLGFAPLETAKIACAAFEIACRERTRQGRLDVNFALEDKLLRVVFARVGTTAEDLQQPLAQIAVEVPEEARLAREDMGWALQQLLRLDRPDLFAELRRHNQDLLQILSQLEQAKSPATSALKLASFAA